MTLASSGQVMFILKLSSPSVKPANQLLLPNGLLSKDFDMRNCSLLWYHFLLIYSINFSNFSNFGVLNFPLIKYTNFIKQYLPLIDNFKAFLFFITSKEPYPNLLIIS